MTLTVQLGLLESAGRAQGCFTLAGQAAAAAYASLLSQPRTQAVLAAGVPGRASIQ